MSKPHVNPRRAREPVVQACPACGSTWFREMEVSRQVPESAVGPMPVRVLVCLCGAPLWRGLGGVRGGRTPNVEASAWEKSIRGAVGWLSERRRQMETQAGSAQFATLGQRDGAAAGLQRLGKEVGRLLARTDEKRGSPQGRTWSPPKRLPAEGSRDQLVVALQERGFSLRQARKLVEVIWQVIADALRRGESVETPLGTFRVVSSPPRRTRFRLGRFQTLFRNRRRIVFKGIVL